MDRERNEGHDDAKPERALDRFADLLHPGVLADIDHWATDPALRELRAALHAHADDTAFFDSFAEALVARHLLRHRCGLRWEVPTPLGKRCDFEVQRGDEVLYLHIKRLQSEQPRTRRLTISPRLRYLERIKRPYVVRVRWRSGLKDHEMQRFVAKAAQFIAQARVGDELTIYEEPGASTGPELGGVRIVAPWSGSHVSLAIGLPDGFIDQTPRIHKLMDRAYGQFMPGALNVIIVCSMNQDDAEDFQNALLGSHIERWDAVPRKGQRIAHGRDSDGFWHGGRSPESVAAGWFAFRPSDHEIHLRLWQRKGVILEPSMQALVSELFAAGQDAVGE